MTAEIVKVKTKPGRIARVSPRGAFIPEDRFVKVDLTRYMRRLIEVHKDVFVEEEVVAAPPEKQPTPPKPKKTTETTVEKE